MIDRSISGFMLSAQDSQSLREILLAETGKRDNTHGIAASRRFVWWIVAGIVGMIGALTVWFYSGWF